MSVSPASRSWTWLAAIALAGLATMAAACGGSTPSTPADTAEARRRRPRNRSQRLPADDADEPLPPPEYERRCRRACDPAWQDVHRRPGRDGGAPSSPRRGHGHPDLLLRGQGRAARPAYEMGNAFEDELNKKLKTGNAKVNVVFVPLPRTQMAAALIEGKVDLVHGPGHHPAGIAGTGGLHQPHAHERQRGRRHLPEHPADCISRRPVRERRLRPHGQQSYYASLIGLNRAPQRHGQAARRHPGDPREPRRRRRARDGQRGPHPHHGRR